MRWQRAPAKVGETLITTTFPGTPTRGFASESDPAIAVCMLPGTELAFDQEVKYDSGWVWTKTINIRVGKFGGMNRNVQHSDHDAIKFPDRNQCAVNSSQRGPASDGASIGCTPEDIGRRSSVCGDF
jgi:hypothetical protein